MDYRFKPPVWLRNAHLQTVWPSLFRRVRQAPPETERLETPDGDFLNLDWYRAGSNRLAIISHGLEGHSRRPYVLGMARRLLGAGWDVLAWNYRSCGGEMNRTLRFYHSGATEDLDWVVRHALAVGGYEQAVLVGFSMGGNLTLKYLGEREQAVDSRLSGAVTFSVPCDLGGSARQLARLENRIYMARFIRDLRAKMEAKARLFPGKVDLTGIERMRTFAEFDDRYTAPLHGFANAQDYWRRCSCQGFIGGIRVPALIVNAWDDPFLSASCYPREAVADNASVTLEIPRWGGHVGFVPGRSETYWSEERACAFFEAVCG